MRKAKSEKKNHTQIIILRVENKQKYASGHKYANMNVHEATDEFFKPQNTTIRHHSNNAETYALV